MVLRNRLSKRLSKLISFTLLLCMMVATLSMGASADEPYQGYTYDEWADPVPSQNGYIVSQVISGKDLGIGSFNEPVDIFYTPQKEFYIVDRKNNRIVILNQNFELVRVMDKFYKDGQETTLVEPNGVFVDENGMIYIADSGNSRAFRCDQDGNIQVEFLKPDTEGISEDGLFLPQKLVVDKAGNVYISITGGLRGALMYDKEGNFVSFYGANRVAQTAEVLMDQIWKLILTREQRMAMRRNVSIEIDNLDIDEDGFIFTVTRTTTQVLDRVKKLNPSGINIFDNAQGNEYMFGDYATTARTGDESTLVDIDIGENGIINVLDQNRQRVFQYDRNANLLFTFGGQSNQKGMFTLVSAIESTEDEVIVLDSMKQSITVFKKTLFGSLVHEATELYNRGYYDEAFEPWTEVIKRDGNYVLAYKGLGNAYLGNGDFENAMEMFELAIDRDAYDRAFEGYRTEFLRANFTYIVLGLVLLIVLVKLVPWLIRKYKKSKGKGEGAA